MSLLLAICLLGAGGVIGKPLSSEGLPPSTVGSVDVILEINKHNSFLMEGDIIQNHFSMFSSRNLQWPKIDGLVTIPYVLSDAYEKAHRKIIQDAFNDLQSSTCLLFVYRTNQRDYISIEPENGCFSNVGHAGKKQLVSLSFDCLKKGKGVVLHELMHVAGFWHEHSRADRDTYVFINWGNIMSGYERNFCKYETPNMYVRYDYLSILHYSSKAFSKNGSLTIVPLQETSIGDMGQRVKLSASDILRVNKYYSCPQYTPLDGDNEIITNDSSPVAYACHQENVNAAGGLSEGVFSKTAPTPIMSFSKEYELSPDPISSSTGETKLSPALMSSFSTEESKLSPALMSSFSTEESKLSPTLMSSFSTEESKLSPALMSSFSTEESKLSPALMSSFSTEESKLSPALMSSFSTEESKLSPALMSSFSTEESKLSPALMSSSSTEESKLSPALLSSSSSTQSIDQLPNHSFIDLASTPLTVNSPATTSEYRASTRDEWSIPLKTSPYADFKFNLTKEEKETIENKTIQGIYVETKTLVGTTVMSMILEGSLTEAISQTSVLPPKGTMSILEIEENTTLKTSVSSKSNETQEQTTSEETWNSSGQDDAFDISDDPDSAQIKEERLKIVGKRSLPEQIFSSKLGEFHGSRAKGYLRWIHANTRKTAMLTLGSEVKQSRRVLWNLFLQKKDSTAVSASLPPLAKIIPQMPYVGGSSEVKYKPEPVCGFEHGLCGWKQSLDDDFDWSLSWGSLNPYNGYFIRRGFHLSLKSNPRKATTGQKALLLSPILQPSSCISFWYGSRHHTMGTLNVYIISSSGEQTLLWSTGGQDHIRWTKAQIQLPPLPHFHDLQVVVEGMIGPSDESSIVIDNLYVGQCS